MMYFCLVFKKSFLREIFSKWNYFSVWERALMCLFRYVVMLLSQRIAPVCDVIRGDWQFASALLQMFQNLFTVTGTHKFLSVLQTVSIQENIYMADWEHTTVRTPLQDSIRDCSCCGRRDLVKQFDVPNTIRQMFTCDFLQSLALVCDGFCHWNYLPRLRPAFFINCQMQFNLITFFFLGYFIRCSYRSQNMPTRSQILLSLGWYWFVLLLYRFRWYILSSVTISNHYS